MSNGFEGYGESEIITCYCEEISLEEIQRRTSILVENFRNPDKVFLSIDLYADLCKQITHYGHTSQMGVEVIKINTDSGIALEVVRIPGMCNFCLVGTEDDYNLVEKAKIDKAFEEIVFDGEDNVYWGSTLEDNQLSAEPQVPSVVKPTNNRG